jgi:hypothetical protein
MGDRTITRRGRGLVLEEDNETRQEQVEARREGSSRN